MQSFYQGSQQRNAVPDSPIKHFFTWYEVTSRGRTRAIGERFKHLFFSTLNLPDDDEWRFERPMGKGSFGAAALFSKVNQRQERTDVSDLVQIYQQATKCPPQLGFRIKSHRCRPASFPADSVEKVPSNPRSRNDGADERP